MNPLISVIIPVYNTESYLSRCMDSIIRNTYREIEIICVNDGSTDRSLSVLLDYQRKDNRIAVIDAPHSGVSNARNIGLEQAKGDYICFIDSDDWIHKCYFTILVNKAMEYNAEMVVCGIKRTKVFLNDESLDEDKVKTTVFESEQGANNHTIKTHIGGHFFKREIINDIRFLENVRLSEDTLFNLRIIANNPDASIVLIDDELYYYFNREDSAYNFRFKSEYKKLGYIFLDWTEKAADKRSAGLFLNEAFKSILSVRYLTSFQNDKESKRELKELMKRCMRQERINKLFSKRVSIVYRTFAYCPFTYWLYRRIVDPSVLEWMKEKRELEDKPN